MNFLKSLFKRSNKTVDNVLPNRRLNLQLEPTPDNAQKLSEQFRDAVKNNDGVNLDYSIDTLEFVDEFLEKFRNQLKVDDFAETIFVAGCYVGQVMVVNANGNWVTNHDAMLPNEVQMMPIIVELPNKVFCDPIAKAFKRFAHGESDNLVFFYNMFTQDL